MAQGPVTVDGTWFEFTWSGSPPVAAKGCSPADPAGITCGPGATTGVIKADAPPWTFTCFSGGCWVTVTDAFVSSDRFEIFDFGASQGLTSVPISGGSCNDADLCVPDPFYSSGMFMVGAGPHSLTITTVSGLSSGAAFFKIDQHAAVGGEPISLDSTMILVAGAQNNAAWMIPVIVSGIGFAIVIARKF